MPDNDNPVTETPTGDADTADVGAVRRFRRWLASPAIAPLYLLVPVLCAPPVALLILNAEYPDRSWTRNLADALTLGWFAGGWTSFLLVCVYALQSLAEEWMLRRDAGRLARFDGFATAVLIARVRYYTRADHADPLSAGVRDYDAYRTGRAAQNTSAWELAAIEYLSTHPQMITDSTKILADARKRTLSREDATA